MAHVTIVGGGLAGMIAAMKLLDHGLEVSLYESSDRLGGKAGANLNEGHRNDHGNHVFPSWYLNTWRLVDELGIQDHFVDIENLNQLLPGQFPRLTTLRSITSVKNALPNLRAGFIPIRDMLLFFYAALDLASQPYARRATLDQLSVTGFLRPKWYRTEGLEQVFRELILKAITAPSYDVSAMTVKNVLQFWMKYSSPGIRILSGDMQTFYIDHIVRRLQSLGCQIHLNMKLVRIEPKGSRVACLHFRDDRTGTSRVRDAEEFILAIPSHNVPSLLDDAVFSAAPDLGKLLHLHSQPMAALDIYLKQKMAGMPKEHVNLKGAQFGLSVIDISNVWSGYKHTVLTAIASDIESLATLSSEHAIGVLTDEIRRYLPFDLSDIERCVFQPHVDEPLFVNVVGTWALRPTTKTQLDNMYLAGDYGKTRIDVVSMEGAIVSGLLAAEAVRAKVGLGSEITIMEPNVHPEWLLRACKWALAPIAVFARWLPSLGSRTGKGQNAVS